MLAYGRSMGTAWQSSSSYPWETTRYVSGIEVVKVNITLRIYAAKWHVYAGLAMLNPSAQSQIQQYARSTTELFKLMVESRAEELEERVWRAREGVFGWKRNEDGDGGGGGSGGREGRRAPILLSEDVLDQFSLGQRTEKGEGGGGNSHLSLLAMVDCWDKLGIRPFEHLVVAGTPVFMIWIGEPVPVLSAVRYWKKRRKKLKGGLVRSRRVSVPVKRVALFCDRRWIERSDTPARRRRVCRRCERVE